MSTHRFEFVIDMSREAVVNDRKDIQDEYQGKVLDRADQDQPSSSRILKFGMDRILSDDITPIRKSSPVSISLSEERCPESSPPCSECVSSLLRCCRLGADSPHYLGPFYSHHHPHLTASVLHNPKPIRPYTNLIIESEAPERNPMVCNNTAKRKRSWSRAVFSNLQRKGLEKRFQIQKYITKPDRRQLAATLGLTDAQVKVWFQNRRMKWRHSKELKFHSGNFATESQVETFSSTNPSFSSSILEHNN